MLLTATPSTISAQIRKLCAQLRPDTEPVFLVPMPDPDCEPLDCFNCVRRKVAREGGRIQFGWAIWEWPRVFLEGEHHAVYEPPSGPPWVDITPFQVAGMTRRLFLPDDAATYDFENEGVRKDNARLALSDDPLIGQFFNVGRARHDLMNSIPGIGAVSVSGSVGNKIASIEAEQIRLYVDLAMKYTQQNARCFCGSGTKFKRCHGQSRGRR
jgi:hypothetical protein